MSVPIVLTDEERARGVQDEQAAGVTIGEVDGGVPSLTALNGPVPAQGFAEFREAGLLWLVNKVVFHPRGFALAFDVADDGAVTGWKMLGDGREVWSFTEADDDEGFAAVRSFLATVTT